MINDNENEAKMEIDHIDTIWIDRPRPRYEQKYTKCKMSQNTFVICIE